MTLEKLVEEIVNVVRVDFQGQSVQVEVKLLIEKFLQEHGCEKILATIGPTWAIHSAKFAAGISEDYLLSKCASMEPDSDVLLREIRRQADDRLAEGRITADEHNEILEELQSIEDEYGSADVVSLKLYELPELDKLNIEWCDITSRDYKPCDYQFARRLWPLFVEAMQPAPTHP